jgi:hypothetical protein
MMHPRGEIEVDLQTDNRVLRGQIILPDGVAGDFVSGGVRTELHSGAQRVEAPVQ